jgi:hypothetical protein
MRGRGLAAVILAWTAGGMGAWMAASTPAAAARPPHPWCMVVQDLSGVWACAFDSFEQCRVEARSGNEGFCAPNPFYAPPPAHATPPRRHRRSG